MLVRAGDESGGAILSSCAVPCLSCKRCPQGESPRPCILTMKGFYLSVCTETEMSVQPSLPLPCCPPPTPPPPRAGSPSSPVLPIGFLLQAVCPDVPRPSLLLGTHSGCQASRGETLALKAGGTGWGAVCCPGPDSVCRPHGRRSLADPGQQVCALSGRASVSGGVDVAD